MAALPSSHRSATSSTGRLVTSSSLRASSTRWFVSQRIRVMCNWSRNWRANVRGDTPTCRAMGLTVKGWCISVTAQSSVGQAAVFRQRPLYVLGLLGPMHGHHHPPGYLRGRARTVVEADHVEAQVNPRRQPRASQQLAFVDVPDGREPGPEMVGLLQCVVAARPSSKPVAATAKARAMGRGIDERVDDLQLLDDRAGPSVRNDERQRFVMVRAR